MALISYGCLKLRGQNGQIGNRQDHTLKRVFVEIGEMLDAGAFVDDYSTITLEAPDMPESFIQKSCVHVGESTTQKTLLRCWPR